MKFVCTQTLCDILLPHLPCSLRAGAGLGTLQLHGPTNAPKGCRLGEACVITLNGVGLAAGNSILVIKNNGRNCGEQTAMVRERERPSPGPRTRHEA